MSSTSQRRSRTWAEARNESWRTEWLCFYFICSSGNFSLSVVDQAGNVPLRNSATLSLCTLKKRLVSKPFYRIPNGVPTWADTVTKAINETGLDQFPNVCPWD